MLAIKNNPYRIIGLLIGASAREQLSRTKKLKMFLEVEQEPDEDFSFPVLGDLTRTADAISEVPARINLNQDRMNAALFWFINNGIADEPAFDALQALDMQTAAAVWRKLMLSGEVTSRSYSAFQNLSTLHLNNAFRNGGVDTGLLEEGILMKLKFLESDNYSDFVRVATDETFKISKEELQKNFLSKVYAEAEKNGVNAQLFLTILGKASFSAKSEYLKTFAHQPIEQIEKQIEEAKRKRKTSPSNAAGTGKQLYLNVIDSLSQLKSILGPTDIRFTTLSDKVAEEVLQCGIDYFKYYRESNTDPGNETMDCVRKAKVVAIGNVAKQRCQENMDNLQEWIDDKPNRERQQRILQDLERIKDLIDEYESKSPTITNAKEFLNKSRLHVQNVKSTLGSSDELYIGLSTRIAADAQGMVVSEINAIQNRLGNTYDQAGKLMAIVLLKQKVDEAWDVTLLIGNMDLRSDFRSHFNTNKQGLSSLRNQLSSVNVGTGRSGGSGGGGGCYIATMAYGDYDHPQVVVLRQFRDEILSKFKLGLWVIKTYYQYSPKLVEILKNKRLTNTCIRFILNQIIKMIKR